MKCLLILGSRLSCWLRTCFTGCREAPAAVESHTLSAMGLGGMQKMSDRSRHRQFAARARSPASGAAARLATGGQSASNNYQAGSSWHGKPAFAKGGSLSFAGKVNAKFAADPTGFAL